MAPPSPPNFKPPDSLVRFAKLVVGRPQVPLAEAALEIGRVEDPDFDGDLARGRLDDLKEMVRAADPGESADPVGRLESLRHVLVEEAGFSGHPKEVGRPAASCLHLVLQRQTGLPILLSILYMEMARSIGLALKGVGLPGRFIVRLADVLPPVFADPFDQGILLDEGGCAALLDEISGGNLQMQPEYMHPWSNRRILWRLLNNLKVAYVEAQDLRRARQVVDHQITLQPAAPEPWRDRGLLAYRSLLFGQAVGDLETYLEMAPKAKDGPAIRLQLKSLRRLVGCIN
ncbi:MAG: transglutaminase-like domain-containing protein [Acidobacteria bacterium]|nr:transglutaminase-like domain-containing protein [Acidobacteriota bacterium]